MARTPTQCQEVWLLVSNQQRPQRMVCRAPLPKVWQQKKLVLKWEDTYRYLGEQVGRMRLGGADELSNEILGVVDKILQSKLTDWQKLDAINLFALSKATYHLSTSLQTGLRCQKEGEKSFQAPSQNNLLIFFSSTQQPRKTGNQIH